jgi:acetyl-CoA carboxylase biotin carboxyl carrier protein
MTTKSTDTMKVDTALVRELAKLLDETRLTEIEVEDHGRKIRVARMGGSVAASAAGMPAAAAPIATAESAPPAPKGDHPGTVKSPMVGSVYLASAPDTANFISIGAAVTAGDTLLIIEAMKVMNPIAAPRSGKVTQIMVANGQPVEFDQPLVVIE